MIRRVAIELILLGFIVYYGVQYIAARGYDPLDAQGSVAVSGGRRAGLSTAKTFVPTGAQDIAEKNPFHPDRGVPPPISIPEPLPVLEPIPEQTPPLPITLKGIVLGDDGEKIAVVVRAEEGSRLMREGDTLGDVTIISIESDRVTVLRREGEEVLNLRDLRTIDVEGPSETP